MCVCGCVCLHAGAEEEEPLEDGDWLYDAFDESWVSNDGDASLVGEVGQPYQAYCFAIQQLCAERYHRMPRDNSGMSMHLSPLGVTVTHLLHGRVFRVFVNNLNYPNVILNRLWVLRVSVGAQHVDCVHTSSYHNSPNITPRMNI